MEGRSSARQAKRRFRRRQSYGGRGRMRIGPFGALSCNSTSSVKNKGMVDRDKIQFDLIKLLNGERVLRLTEPQSGLSLEKKLAPTDAVVRQKEKLLGIFEAALTQAELAKV